MNLDSSSESGSDDMIGDDELNDMGQAVPFDGDAFGSAQDYADEHFGQPDMMEDEATADPGIDSEEEEEQVAAAQAAELKSSWEPRWEGEATIPGQDGQAEEPITEDADQASQARQAAEERLGFDPFVVKYSSCYPRSRCGAIKKSQHTSDQQYSSAIDNPSNPWAPFSSEIDWKVARWAKLRGAGSTAFSDLLAINGVH